MTLNLEMKHIVKHVIRNLTKLSNKDLYENINRLSVYGID